MRRLVENHKWPVLAQRRCAVRLGNPLGKVFATSLRLHSVCVLGCAPRLRVTLSLYKARTGRVSFRRPQLT